MKPVLSRLGVGRRQRSAAVLEGFVDALDDRRMLGWAWDRNAPEERVVVDVYVDGRLARSVIADQLGGDLAAARIGDGRHRWSCDLQELVQDGVVHELSARFGGTDVELNNSPKKYLRGILDLIPDLEVQAVLAARHIRGRGIEIGALNKPLPVPPGAETMYVDRMTADELKAEYPEMSDYDLVPVDIVDDGETLAKIPDASVDFVIANNLLEHCEDPIGTLKTFFRVVRPGGVLFLVIPNRRANIDVDRPETPIEHLVADHENGPEGSRAQHYDEWTRDVLKVDHAQVAHTTRRLMDQGYSIHYHVFTEFEVLELFGILKRRYGLSFSIEHLANNADHEMVVVARRRLP